MAGSSAGTFGLIRRARYLLDDRTLNGAEALKNCRPDDRVLTVRPAHVGPENVVVSIQDCGIGLTQGNLEQLFTPFYTTKASGMGMGLSIARSVVESHNGRLWATNNPDRGAAFSFSLPVEAKESA